MNRFEEWFKFPPPQRCQILRERVMAAHRYHFERNAAYRRTITARGITADSGTSDLARFLRPSALTFKGYIEAIGPFPQDKPQALLNWLADQLSIPLDQSRRPRLGSRYGTLEALLCDIERIYADSGLEIVTSSGTSGRASLVVRDTETVGLAVDAFFSGIQRAWGIGRGMAMVFVMPRETRVAMARVARFGTQQLEWAAESPVYYTMPFSATPDLLRIRAGRNFRPGVQGLVEKRVMNPFMEWANAYQAMPRTIALTAARLRECASAGQSVMLLGGPVQLHLIAQAGAIPLPAGSRVATGGGMKEHYGFTLAQIRDDLSLAFGHIPVSDVYGMAEANWAAFECAEGNYHIPPWVYAVVTDDDDRIISEPDATGLLAFLDPIGGGRLIPPFFQTADRVRLINGGDCYDPARACPCGYDTPFIAGDICRVDLVDEAGCAGQL